MHNDNLQPSSTPANDSGNPSVQPTPKIGGQRVIQPTPEFVQELEEQQQQQQPQQAAQSAAISAEATQPAPQSHTEPSSLANDQMQIGMSASQMGLNQSKSKVFDFDFKKLLVKGLVALIVLGGVIAVMVFTNIIALSQFKTIDYTNSRGNHYSLMFYTKHGSKTLKSGNPELVSKVSVDGKFPITLSIASGNESGYARAKNCSGFTKVFDVQNDSLNQKISVCNLPLGQNVPNGVYIAGILYKNQTSIVTISQDISSTDLSGPSGAQQSLAKFGLDPYQDDITKIIASIKIK
jgi:hypothetical protein